MLGPGKLSQQTISEFWQDSYMNNLRTSMINNEPVGDCLSCYTQEKNFGSSMRTEGLRDYKFDNKDVQQQLIDLQWMDLKNPKRLEIHVSNLCNLKCLTCNPSDSSSFLAENKLLGISNHNQTDFTINESTLNNVIELLVNGNVDLLDLRGGESMLVPSIRTTLDNLPEYVYKNTTLRIQTNGTVLTRAWKDLLKRFSKVEIMLSVDSVDEYNKYIRYPANWDDIQEFADWVVLQSNIHCFVACTVSNLNLLSLDMLIEWCKKQNLYCHLAILRSPEIYKFTNLPGDVLKKAQQKLDSYSLPKISGIIAAEPENNKDLWQSFCSAIDMRDKHRGNRIFDLHPELKEHWVTQK